jgi:hypothetical protein
MADKHWFYSLELDLEQKRDEHSYDRIAGAAKQSLPSLLYTMNPSDSDDEDDDERDDGSLVDLVVQPSTYWCNMLPPKRLLISSTRECYPLQGPGIHQMLDDLESGIISS